MFKLFFIVYFISELNAQLINPANCGQRPLIQDKIVNGQKSIVGDCNKAESVEHSVEIGVHNTENKEDWVQIRNFEKLIIHPSFDSFLFRNDIAMIKLDKPVSYDNKYILPVCLPKTELYDMVDKTVWLTGWGYEKFGGKVQSEKREVSMEILNDFKCSRRYSIRFDSMSQMCAGELGSNSGACYGDSGGPVVVKESDRKWYLVGLISWGIECGKGTVFTRVSFHLPFIKENLLNN